MQIKSLQQQIDKQVQTEQLTPRQKEDLFQATTRRAK